METLIDRGQKVKMVSMTAKSKPLPLYTLRMLHAYTKGWGFVQSCLPPWPFPLPLCPATRHPYIGTIANNSYSKEKWEASEEINVETDRNCLDTENKRGCACRWSKEVCITKEGYQTIAKICWDCTRKVNAHGKPEAWKKCPKKQPTSFYRNIRSQSKAATILLQKKGGELVIDGRKDRSS